jgi:hypothetical protein
VPSGTTSNTHHIYARYTFILDSIIRAWLYTPYLNLARHCGYFVREIIYFNFVLFTIYLILLSKASYIYLGASTRPSPSRKLVCVISVRLQVLRFIEKVYIDISRRIKVTYIYPPLSCTISASLHPFNLVIYTRLGY